MLILEHIKQLVEACQPVDNDERLRLWADIKPIKFGNTVLWTEETEYSLAKYQVPHDAAFLIVLRTECYMTNPTPGAADYGLYEPPPSGTAFWRYLAFNNVTTYNVTDENEPVQRLLDCDEFLFFKGGYFAELIGDLDAPPDSDDREVRTLVYGYNCGAMVAAKIGRAEVEISQPF